MPFTGPSISDTDTELVLEDNDFTPIKSFCMFYSDQARDLIVAETNKYSSAKKTKMMFGWKDLSNTELNKWVGIMLYMSVVRYPILHL